jgi:hypothetical protein
MYQCIQVRTADHLETDYVVIQNIVLHSRDLNLHIIVK